MSFSWIQYIIVITLICCPFDILHKLLPSREHIGAVLFGNVCHSICVERHNYNSPFFFYYIINYTISQFFLFLKILPWLSNFFAQRKSWKQATSRSALRDGHTKAEHNLYNLNKYIYSKLIKPRISILVK